ncbi:Nitrogen assimilation regulatory protein NtrX [Thioalkalivibrio nitratireducens DSM 14787]|uniref:Nitrogen assimilation regulatory protein NtrX n=1 Tax=Thioalkalivibrio nitratireducens (strain DSM 14787 / UNIQEM 213 / ALEN2) TaxID=1255043 RepID=L0DT05_THIND|nr:sigma-54 dependent transcriptional regulator [Thioalkalivibrio nitratireducens]AGA32127.1 Nitrogen assimilation regulatory protein NtrX [Thioalkalivibrio nitratireducens DSM 14787]
MSGPYILVVDDEPDIRMLLRDVLEDEGYEVALAGSVAEAKAARRSRRPDLILLDVWMPDGDGISLLKEWNEDGSLPCPVVMISGHGNVETAVDATRLGAYDFIEKPLSIDKLVITLTNALESDRLQRENQGLRRLGTTISEPVGDSAVMNSLRDQVQRMAQHDTWVLISGEAGVGKQTFARFLHAGSARRDNPFIVVAVGSLSGQEAITELFGSEQGDRVRFGLLEQAAGGVLFLDEVAEMDLQTQGRLLHALDTQRITRIGGNQPIAVNVRVVAATKVDLAEAVHQGRFREDLYYRLNVLPLKIPPLREHPEDIPALLKHHMEHLHQQEGLPERRFQAGALERLRRYHWPGNVRELRNFVQRLMILGSGEEVTREEVERTLSGQTLGEADLGAVKLFPDLPLREAREQFERQYLIHQLERSEGNMTRLAERVGLERTHLYRKFKTLGIDPKKLKTDG